MFNELMRRRGPFCFYAFDLLWLDGIDLRERPLSERKALLRKMLPHKPRALVYVQHFRERHGPIPRDWRAGHGGGCRETGKRQVHAGSDNLGKD